MAYTLPLGSKAPDFRLLASDGKFYSLGDVSSDYLVIFFTCIHCPYVQNSDEVTRRSVENFQKHCVTFVVINSNSSNTFEEASYENMVKRMEEHRFPWVYLHDATQ